MPTRSYVPAAFTVRGAPDIEALLSCVGQLQRPSSSHPLSGRHQFVPAESCGQTVSEFVAATSSIALTKSALAVSA
ncbi:MAG: hypothetical protein J0I83_00580 [Nitrobacter sp.]|nr:hypothetical protein [Nitrobacter sp.]